jgi:hypothetical protein
VGYANSVWPANSRVRQPEPSLCTPHRWGSSRASRPRGAMPCGSEAATEPASGELGGLRDDPLDCMPPERIAATRSAAVS